MGLPYAIAFGRDGVWAVTDSSYHCVCIFDGQDQLVRKFGSSGSDNGEFLNPRGLAFDANNHLYVSEYDNHRVQKFHASGEYLLQFGHHGSGDAQLCTPSGMTIHNDRLYIAEFISGRVSEFQLG